MIRIMRRFYCFFAVRIIPHVPSLIWLGIAGRADVCACQITLEQNRSGDAIHHTLPLFPADIGCDQEVFRRLRRQPFVPQNNGNGNSRPTERLETRASPGSPDPLVH